MGSGTLCIRSTIGSLVESRETGDTTRNIEEQPQSPTPESSGQRTCAHWGVRESAGRLARTRGEARPQL